MFTEMTSPVFWSFTDHLLEGAVMTVVIAILAMALAVLLGLAGATGRIYGGNFVDRTIHLYTTILRGIPEIIVIFALYFGATLYWERITSSLGVPDGVEASPLLFGILALGLTFGAYATEVFRAAFLTVDKGEIEAARAFGFSRRQRLSRIVLPQTLRNALPGLGNLFLVLIKDTSLLSIIAVTELMRETRIAISNTQQPFTFYFLAALIYLILTTAALKGLQLLERRYSIGQRTVARHEIF